MRRKNIKSEASRNRILIVLVALVFAITAGAVLHSQHLTEYSGSLDENLSYEMPAGYELMESSTDSNLESKTYVREKADTRETITLYYDGMYTNEEENFPEEGVIPNDEYTEVRINRYDSCSKEQEDEIVEFIKTIKFHRPDGSDLNAIQRLYQAVS